MKRWAASVLVLGFFIGVTALVHRDILAAPSERVFAGQGVGGFFVWLFWWWGFALREGLPMFHTHFLMFPGGVPVFPHSPINEAAALAISSVASPWAAVNFLLLACYALTGWTAWLLLERRTGDGWAALCGAFTYAFSAYMIVQHFHGQVIEATLYLCPLLALAWFRFLETPGARSAGWLGLALTGVILSGPYVAFSFGAVFLAAAVAFDLLWGRRVLARRAVWRAAAVAVGAAGAIGLLAYWPLLRHAGQWIGARSFYSLSLAALVDPPFWNDSPAVQWLRPMAGLSVFPENAMGWLGLGTYALIARAAWDRSLRREGEVRFWGWILLAALVLALGPWLSLIPGLQLPVPLPYWIVSKLPVLASFRNTGRILMTATLAASALAAFTLSRLWAGRPQALRAAGALLFIGFTAWEFDLAAIGRRWVSAAPSAAYRAIAEDPAPGALLELPSSYDADGNLLTFGQYYMLLQPFHRRPMVLGYPSRHLPENLAFTESTEVVYEFTHPWVLRRLDEAGGLADRARRLKREGAGRLRDAGIRWVLWHPRVPAYDADTRRRLETWLRDVLGKPQLTAEDGTLLFRTSL